MTGGVYILSLHQASPPSSSRQAGLARGWGTILLGLGLLALGLGCLALVFGTSTPGAPGVWAGLMFCACGATGRAAARAWYSARVVRLHLAALALNLVTIVSCSLLTVTGLQDSSHRGRLLALHLLLTSLLVALVTLLALGPALHLALALEVRDPEFGARVRRGEMGARLLLLLGGKLVPGVQVPGGSSSGIQETN